MLKAIDQHQPQAITYSPPTSPSNQETDFHKGPSERERERERERKRDRERERDTTQ